jgi:type IV pilus assembly protein PilB
MLASKHTVLPLKRDGRQLTVAIADPTNLGVIDDLKFITRYDIVPVLAGEYSMRTAIEKHYEANDQQMQSLLQDIAATEDDVEVLETAGAGGRCQRAGRAVDDAPVVKLINAILTDAVKRGASDIHFECFEHELRVRYRIDGALQEVMKPPMKMQGRAHLALQDHGVAQHRRASRAAGRAHQAQGGQARSSTSA